jgi:nucleotide-binding universal stress UspA family protein
LLQHNVEVGYGHRYAGVTMEEYAHSLQEHAHKRLDEFIADIDLDGIRVEKVVTCSTRPEEAVVALAVARKMDVVCMGSHGTESIFGALLGDTAERILEECPLPVLIAKKRDEAGQLLDLILKEEV